MKSPNKSLLFASAMLVATLPIISSLYLSRFEFNQFLLFRSRAKNLQVSVAEVLTNISSIYTAGVFAAGQSFDELPEYDDPDSVFQYVLSAIPRTAKVYPTEGFYYWNTSLDAVGSISGNIRLADADLGKGSLTFAYFPVGENANSEQYPSSGLTLQREDGLEVVKHSENHLTLKYKGIERSFIMPKEEAEAPKLYEDEVFVGRVYDESGIAIQIIYNENTKSFYKFLDEDRSVAETIIDTKTGVQVGLRSKFAYFNDLKTKRKLLVGVENSNSKENNYFDGPGDQVPYWIDLKPMLNIAYPATLLGEGIDSHGVYLKREEWTRIAVSPYQFYQRPSQLSARIATCSQIENDSIRQTCLTKEWWNNVAWLDGILSKLKAEGKSIPQAVVAKVESQRNLLKIS